MASCSCDPHPRPRRPRARRGRGAGRLRESARALAAGRHPRHARRLDRHDRPQRGDRPDPARADVRPQGGAAGAARGRPGRGGRRREHDPGRAARAPLHVLPPGPRRRRTGRADTARGGRPRDARDRACVPRRRDDDGAAARPREAPRPRQPESRSACPPDELLPDRVPDVLRGALPRVQRGLRRDRGATRWCAPTSARRRSGSPSSSAS